MPEVENLLSAENNLFQLVVCLDECAIPIIQAKHRATGYLCEFNLNNPGQHVKTSKIIK